MKRTIWHKYYSEHKKKYKMWNKNWREKQNNKSYHLFFFFTLSSYSYSISVDVHHSIGMFKLFLISEEIFDDREYIGESLKKFHPELHE